MEAARKLAPALSSPDGLPAAVSARSSLRSSGPRIRFAELDRELTERLRLRERGESVVLRVSAPAGALDQLANYARRIMSTTGPVVFVSTTASDSPWREAARQVLGVEARESASGGRASAAFAPSPSEVGETLLGARGLSGVVIVEQALSRFGRSVLDSLASLDRGAGGEVVHAGHPQQSPAVLAPVVLVLTASSPPDVANLFDGQSEVPSWFEVDDALERADVEAWWRGVAQCHELIPSCARVSDLESWWVTAHAMVAGGARPVPTLPVLSADAERLLSRLTIAARAWPTWALPSLGATEEALDALERHGLVERVLGSVGLGPRAGLMPQPPAMADDFGVVAGALRDVFANDPVACMRAAEVSAHDPSAGTSRVDELALFAVRSVIDADVREDMWNRYDRLLSTRWQPLSGLSLASAAGNPQEPGVPTPWVFASAAIDQHQTTGNAALATLLGATDVAIKVGDVERAMGFAQGARGLALSLPGEDGRDNESLLALGRAQMAAGDLTSATVSIERALECGSTSSAAGSRLGAARAAVELAELRYTLGQLDDATALAAPVAMRAETAPSLRLAARNVVGKVLLARARFDEADRHFASDASDAACVGDTTAELRARLNRGIALMSQRRYAEARTMLEGIQRVGEARGEMRAVCFALGNLATIAVLEHRYADALDLLDKTIELLRRVGDKPRLAIFVTNLAELRLKLGLDREAEQLLLFGRRVCGVSAPRLAQFSLVSARIQLAKGKTADAFRDLGAALAPSGLTLERVLRGEAGQAHKRGWAGSAGGLVTEALRVAARAALEEGDTEKALAFIDGADAESESARSQAEIAVLRAAHARALGEPFQEAAAEALRLARGVDEDDLTVEAHVLSAQAIEPGSSDAGDASAATHLARAREIRGSIAATLPAWVRDRYLARRDSLSTVPERPRHHHDDAGAAATLRSGSSSTPAPACAVPARGEAGAARSIVGAHPTIRALMAAVRKMGPSDGSVLIHGESGTGKELVADALHDTSLRRSGPLVKVNCAALVETLLLSELFGHEKGAFTGAAARRRGRFEAAEGGTLFLDEIGDISHRTQVALLRVLQEKSFERVGGTAPIRANVRVVCATHRDLPAMVARGEFREDLYYRLCGMVLEVPALRERLSDLPVIADALLARIAGERAVAPTKLSARSAALLARHAWPGNVRELENALRAASLFAEGAELEVEDFTQNVESLRFLATASLPTAPACGVGMQHAVPQEMAAAGVQNLTAQVGPVSTDGASAPSPALPEVAYAHIRSGVSLADIKKQIERDCIARALQETDGNITRAAALLGMKRPRLSQLVKQYGLGADGVGDDSELELAEEDEG